MDMQTSQLVTIACESLGVHEAQVVKARVEDDGTLILLVDCGIGGIKKHHVNPDVLPQPTPPPVIAPVIAPAPVIPATPPATPAPPKFQRKPRGK